MLTSCSNLMTILVVTPTIHSVCSIALEKLENEGFSLTASNRCHLCILARVLSVSRQDQKSIWTLLPMWTPDLGWRSSVLSSCSPTSSRLQQSANWPPAHAVCQSQPPPVCPRLNLLPTRLPSAGSRMAPINWITRAPIISTDRPSSRLDGRLKNREIRSFSPRRITREYVRCTRWCW